MGLLRLHLQWARVNPITTILIVKSVSGSQRQEPSWATETRSKKLGLRAGQVPGRRCPTRPLSIPNRTTGPRAEQAIRR